MRVYFRVEIPRKINKFLMLCQNILNKHQNDGVGSILSILDMSEMNNFYVQAKNYHELFEKESRDKETAFQQRNIALGINYNQYSFTPKTVLFYISSIRDYLLGIYLNSEQMLGNWGYDVNMSNGFVSVKIPRRAVDLLALGNQIYKKHLNDGASSVLSPLDMDKMGNLLA